jgi:hypothetical protein
VSACLVLSAVTVILSSAQAPRAASSSGLSSRSAGSGQRRPRRSWLRSHHPGPSPQDHDPRRGSDPHVHLQRRHREVGRGDQHQGEVTTPPSRGTPAPRPTNRAPSDRVTSRVATGRTPTTIRIAPAHRTTSGGQGPHAALGPAGSVWSFPRGAWKVRPQLGVPSMPR